MSCRICHRSSCTESFHSLEEQELFAQREAMPDDVETLRRMVQEAAADLVSFKDPQCLHAYCKRHLSDADVANLFGERMTEIVNQNAQLVEALEEAIWWSGDKKQPLPDGLISKLRALLAAAKGDAS